jgi:predicted amidohydrolase YtcJ
MVLIHGRFITMDQARPKAESVAITGDRITWIGTDAEAQKLFIGKSRVVDLQGATVLPGLIDAHGHLLELGKSLLRINLKGINSEAEAVAKVKERVTSAAPNEWILGWGWDEGQWASNYPTNKALSDVSPNNPVYLVGLHSFAAWANRKALQLAGVDASTKDPESGRVLRDPNTGEPTGVLLNQAQRLVESHIPSMTPEQTEKAIELAAAECVRNGLTTVHDARVSPSMLEAFRNLIARDRLPLRVYAILDGADSKLVDGWLESGPEIDQKHRLTVRSFKLFADGALGSRGAWLSEPYSDAPQTRGVITTPGPQVYQFTRRAVERGFQVCTHAIGDAANHMVLDAYARVLHELPRSSNARLRIEHAQVLAGDDVPRFAKLGVIASMQPTHCTSDMPWAEKRVGPARIKGAYAWRSLLKTGVHLPLSSDFPGETLNPFFSFYAAITRQDTEGKPAEGWYPAERLTLEEALRGYTIEAAYAEFEEQNKGSIAKGKLADLVVISDDITKISPKEILSLRVLKTFIGGKLVYGP